MADPRFELAMELFQRAYDMQMSGELDVAVGLYQRSIETFPTAEAYTFLGWTYRHQGRIDEAIEECKNAILIDPTLGNPYNDIGAYLIDKGQYDAAIPWLEKASASKRYASYHYPWYNLARAYTGKELYTQAQQCLEKALQIEPSFQVARDEAARLRRLVQ
jgi:tetratricopeptide (TPR) repeat protein